MSLATPPHTPTPVTKPSIGPADHGRRMSLAEYEFVDAEPGHQYELSRGIITVSNVPNFDHAEIVTKVHEALVAFKMGHAGVIRSILGAADCKLLVVPFDSERHPDVSVYLTEPPRRDRELWRIWIPEIVIEVVSENSVDRDYFVKADEYLQLGVKEYWIVDPLKKQVTLNVRTSGAWATSVLNVGESIKTHLLAGFELTLETIFGK